MSHVLRRLSDRLARQVSDRDGLQIGLYGVRKPLVLERDVERGDSSLIMTRDYNDDYYNYDNRRVGVASKQHNDYETNYNRWAHHRTPESQFSHSTARRPRKNHDRSPDRRKTPNTAKDSSQYDVWTRASTSSDVDHRDPRVFNPRDTILTPYANSTRESEPKKKRSLLTRVISKLMKVIIQLLLISIVVAGYTLAGGFLFWYLEGEYEKERLQQDNMTLIYRRGNLTESLVNIYNTNNPNTSVSYGLCQSDCRDRIESLIVEFDSGNEIDPKDYNQFQIQEATFYAMTLYTTIGYGTVFPHTDNGKIATIIYAIVGIPLIMVILGKLGAMIEDLISGIVNLIKRFVRCGNVGEATLVPTLVTLLTVAAYVAAACYFVMMHSDLNYLDAIYFTFISFTTIGLGDVMPDESFNLYSTAIFLVGLALLASVIASLSAFFMKWYERSHSQMNDITGKLKLTSAAASRAAMSASKRVRSSH